MLKNFTYCMEKLADLILLSFAWLICSLPVVTVAVSSSALYYAVVKNVRKERGTALHEFFGFFKANWKQGIGVSLSYILLGVLAAANIRAVSRLDQSSLMYAVYRVESLWIGLMFVFLSVYLFPVFSRFEYGVFEGIKVSILMSLRHMLSSLVLAAVLAFTAVLTARYPVLALIFPGLWMLFLSLRMEKIFVKYMKMPQDGEDIPWYWEDEEKIVQGNEKK